MTFSGIVGRAAAALLLCLAASHAGAAAPEDMPVDIPAAEAATMAPVTVYELETEMVVRDWVLCVSPAVAKELVRAREESVERARSAYAEFQAARSCGQFPELRVILRERVYESAAESGHDARVFEALVNIADDWASAFVVYGGLPVE